MVLEFILRWIYPECCSVFRVSFSPCMSWSTSMKMPTHRFGEHRYRVKAALQETNLVVLIAIGKYRLLLEGGTACGS